MIDQIFLLKEENEQNKQTDFKRQTHWDNMRKLGGIRNNQGPNFQPGCSEEGMLMLQRQSCKIAF